MLDQLPEQSLRDYQPAWVLRAHCLIDLGGAARGAAAARRAVGLTEDPAVRRHLQQVLGDVRPG